MLEKNTVLSSSSIFFLHYAKQRSSIESERESSESNKVGRICRRQWQRLSRFLRNLGDPCAFAVSYVLLFTPFYFQRHPFFSLPRLPISVSLSALVALLTSARACLEAVAHSPRRSGSRLKIILINWSISPPRRGRYLPDLHVTMRAQKACHNKGPVHKTYLHPGSPLHPPRVMQTPRVRPLTTHGEKKGWPSRFIFFPLGSYSRRILRLRSGFGRCLPSPSSLFFLLVQNFSVLLF